MRERGLLALCSRRFVPRTSDGKASLPAANLLEGRALPEAPNQVWCADITYIPSSGGWLYLAVVIDLFSRRIVGWHLNDHMKSDLVVGALKKALATRAPLPGELIFHSDRGSQYGSRAFRSCLEENGIAQSMSKKAYPYDNAWTESFMGTLKSEMLGGGIFDTPADAHSDLATSRVAGPLSALARATPHGAPHAGGPGGPGPGRPAGGQQRSLCQNSTPGSPSPSPRRVGLLTAVVGVVVAAAGCWPIRRRGLAGVLRHPAALGALSQAR